MNNFLLLMGRGIEGTGNTRITIELEEYFKEIGNNAITVASSDKIWGREKSQTNDIIQYKFANGPYVPEVSFDTVLILSVPAKRKVPARIKTDPEELAKFETEQKAIYEGFTQTLENMKAKGAKIVYLQVDHKIHSINRNYYAIDEYLRRFFPLLDLVITPKLDNDFMKKFVEKKVYPLNLEGVHFKSKEQLLISCDFDKEYNDLFNKGNILITKIQGLCTFIGRSARWKGWTDFRDFHYKYLKDAGFVSIIEGIELSINGKEDLYIKEGKKFIAPKQENIVYVGDKTNTIENIFDDLINNREKYNNLPAMVFGPYNRKEAMNRMSKAKFGMFFTYLGEEFSGPIEITFLEIVASGTVPVIKKELYETAQFNGDRLSNYRPEDIGLVIYDENNPEETVSIMKTLDYSDGLYNTYLKNITNFCKANFDRKVILKRVYDLITEA